MKSFSQSRLLPTLLVVFPFLLTACVSGNNKLQAEYDRGESDAVKELYWAKERAKQPSSSSETASEEYLEIPVDQDPNALIKEVPHTRVLPVLSTQPQ